jgi:TolB-like protein/Tfp pilus assembly protein PilF
MPEPAERTAQTKAHIPLGMANRTAIAVLPFRNLAEQDQHYFAEGFSEELSIALGRVPWLLVIASSAAAPYRGGATDLARVSTELGARYALRGSVRRENDRVRIVTQLLHAANGSQIWAERFEGASSDLFTIQDRIVGQACAKLAPALQSIEIDLSRRKQGRNLTAYDLYLRALPCFRSSFEDNRQALQMLIRAVEIDPLYACAYGFAARCYQFQRLFGWVRANDPILLEGVRLARIAADLGREDSEALWMAGIALAQLAGEIDHGRALIERSLALNPNSASAWIASSFVHGEIGDTDAALEHFENAQRLNPLDSLHHFQWLAAGFAHFVAGRYENAAAAIDRTLMAGPAYVPAIRLKVSVCGLLGQRAEGARWVRRLREAIPTASLSRLAIFWRAPVGHNREIFAKLLEGARLAGLPQQSAC